MGVRVVEDEAADQFLNLVLDSGINFIDTSPDYGVSEERIGALSDPDVRSITCLRNVDVTMFNTKTTLKYCIHGRVMCSRGISNKFATTANRLHRSTPVSRRRC